MNLALITGWFAFYRYPIIFVATVIEGPIIMMLSGVMLRLSVVSFLPILVTLIAGDLIGDVFWYSLGYHFAHPIAEKYGHFVGLTSEVLEKTKSMFKNHPTKILFISKITMGFGFALAVLVAAGMSKMSFKKYLMVNFLGQFIWTGLLLVIGYFFGNLYVEINNDLKIATTVASVVILFFVFRGINSYLRTRNMEKDLEGIL